MKKADPVDQVISKAQQHEAGKNLKKEIASKVKEANSNFANSESTTPQKSNVKKKSK